MSNPTADERQLIRETFIAGVERHAVIGSTSDRAKELAARGATALPWLILADAQTDGRGRGPNRWWTGPGSLAMSLLVDPRALRIDSDGRPLIVLATALAVVDTVEPLLRDRQLQIHWPNDVMADRRKLAGILVEALTGGLTVVGIGLNTNNRLDDAPEELRHTATTVFDLTGKPHDRAATLTTLLKKLAEAYSLLAHDPSRIARRADQLCLQRGETLSIESAGQPIEGRCEGIAPDGALLIETRCGRQTIHSGTLR